MKKIYEQPETVVTRVELESPICSGSTTFTGPEGTNGVHVSGQGVIQPGVGDNGGTLNDFTGNSWEIDQTVN